ncbi:MAG TPA: alpha/beta hydrolase [Blastocatellia bacterium]|nr:alpha/beta hydrolase [Blastocatellia bacterium]
MPFTEIAESPLIPGTTPVTIHYREVGSGYPLVFLHGGWGYEVYPFDSQIAAFGEAYQILIPDRTGYGRSPHVSSLPVDFHRRAALEMNLWLGALKIERPILWGHSDGAVIATWMALQWPERVACVILEAFHLLRVKPRSREFFETMVKNPEGLGERVTTALERDHGEAYWRELILMNGTAWLRLAEESRDAAQDLYDGRLRHLRVPALFIHGDSDPRTEAGELDAVRRQLPQARMAIIRNAGHSPHSQASVAAEVNRVAGEFMNSITQP